MDDDFEEEDIQEREERIEENKKNTKKEKVIVNKKYNKPEVLERIRGNPWIISSFVLGALVLILLITNFGGITGNVSKDTASQIILDFANSQVDGELSVVSVESMDDLYEVTILYNGNKVPLYLTKDGKNLVQGVIPVSQLTPSSGSTQTEEIPKTDKPKVELYVMSFCPYGNRGENTMVPAYNLLKNKIDFNVHYIVSVSGNTVSSLHGQPEVDEDEREACVLKNYGMDSWWKFVVYVNNNCGSDGSCWKDAAKSANLDSNKIQSCVNSEGLNLMKQEADTSDKAGATGSPTLVINGVQSSAVYQYGNADAYKQTICSAFNNEPAECSTQLQAVADSGATGSC